MSRKIPYHIIRRFILSVMVGMGLTICSTTSVIPQQLNYWSLLPKPTQHTLTTVHFIDSARGWITGQNGVFMHTSNAGGKWTQQIPGTVGEFPTIEVISSNDLWTLEYKYPLDDTSWFGTNIYHSTNGGATWNTQRFDSSIFRTITFIDSLTGFAGGSNGTIAKTTNRGQSWRLVHVGSKNDSDNWPLYQIRFVSKTFGLAVGGQLDISGLIWKTTDAGETWKPNKVAGDPIFNVHFFDSLHILCGMADLDASGAGFLRSTDGGISWNFENTAIWGEPTAMAFRTMNDLWVPMGIAGIALRSSDQGKTWSEIPIPGQVPVYDISFPDPMNGYMIGHKGALFKFNSTALSASSTDLKPSSFSIEQNYPNPFNGSTTFFFRISERSPVEIRVYDLLGRSIAVIHNGMLERGEHSINWNSGELPSGIYFYRITSQHSSISKKMIIQR